MTAEKVIAALGLETLCMPEPDAEVTDGYVGDLLSWVMGRSQAGQAWVTIMTNVNVVAVASLQELPLVIICDDSRPDGDVITRATEKGVNIALSPDTAYHVCAKLASLLN